MDIGAIIITVVTTLGSVGGLYVTGVFALKAKKAEKENDKKKNEVKELRATFGGLEIINNFKLLSILSNRANYILKKNKPDRFLVLFAINGKRDFNFVNAIWEQHKEHGDIVIGGGSGEKYKNVKIDAHYKDFLKKAEPNGYVVLDTKKMPTSVLKTIYEDEQVTHSLVFFIARISISEDDDVIIYCSIATHQQQEFTHQEILDVELNINAAIMEINGIIKNY